MNTKRFKNLHILSNWVPLLVGIIITLLAASIFNYHNEFKIKTYTHELASKTEDLIKKNFQHFEYGLRGVRGALSAVGFDNITREEFDNYSNSRNIKKEFSGALGFGFIRRVAKDKEDIFIESTRKKLNIPEFSIKTLTPHTKERFVIQYIFPLDKNRQALGLDIGSEDNRRNAAISAAKDDSPYLTAPITLVQANKKSRKGALVLLPVYPPGAILTTPEERERAVLGWSYAPLVIDDVLRGLELKLDQAAITLSNKIDNEIFYSSNINHPTHSNSYEKNRTINVLGQSWELKITPSDEVINQIKPWSIHWIILLGLGLTYFSLLIINLLQNSHQPDHNKNEIYKLSFQSIVAFFRSQKFKQSFPFSAVLFSLILIALSWFIIQSNFKEVSDHLSLTKSSAHSILIKKAAQYQKDVIFLASITIIKSSNNNKHKNNSTDDSKNKEQFNSRLADIFQAYMQSNKDIYQVRFISADNSWQEQVKVQRMENQLKIFSQSELQNKMHEPYIQKTLRLKSGEVYISDINLNREFGKIEKPNRPVWRFSTPIFYPDGRPGGIIIINASANNILTSTSEGIIANTTLYITNSTGNYLLHPKESKAFYFEEEDSSKWQDDFSEINSHFGLSHYQLLSFISSKGRVFAKKSTFIIDQKDNRKINIYSTASQFLVIQKVILELIIIALTLLAVSFISLLIQYWIWLNEIIRYRENLISETEKQRIKETTRFKGLLESAPDAALVVDESGIIQMINAQAEKMFGYLRNELESNSIAKLIPEHLQQSYKQRMTDYLEKLDAADINSPIELVAIAATGITFPIEVSLSSINLDNKILISASVRDITERLESEEKLRKALYDAELATEAKSAFLANTSHEIRTPLNAIIGLGYLLSEENLSEAQHQLVSKIQISGKSLLGIVNDVLDLAKIEANEMELEEHPVDLRELIEEVVEIFSIQAEVKNLDFSFKIDSKLPSWVVTDSTRLRQILINLLSNALKFTTIGKISLYVEAIGIPDQVIENHVQIRISITDY